MVRERSNSAFAKHDVLTELKLNAPEVYIRTASGTTICGRDSLERYLNRIFLSDVDTYYKRVTETISPLGQGSFAEEKGYWRAKSRLGKTPPARSGSYVSYWELREGEWQIAAQIFIATPSSQQ